MNPRFRYMFRLFWLFFRYFGSVWIMYGVILCLFILTFEDGSICGIRTEYMNIRNVGIPKVSRSCPESIQKLCRSYSEAIQKLSRSYPDAIRKVSRSYFMRKVCSVQAKPILLEQCALRIDENIISWIVKLERWAQGFWEGGHQLWQARNEGELSDRI